MVTVSGMKHAIRLLWLMGVVSGVLQPVYAQIATPLEVPDLVFWVDAEDVNGDNTVPADGATVSTWADKSGNGNDLTLEDGTVTYLATGFDSINPGAGVSAGLTYGRAKPLCGHISKRNDGFFC